MRYIGMEGQMKEMDKGILTSVILPNSLTCSYGGTIFAKMTWAFSQYRGQLLHIFGQAP